MFTNVRVDGVEPTNKHGVEWYDTSKGLTAQDCVNACLLVPSCTTAESKWAGYVLVSTI